VPGVETGLPLTLGAAWADGPESVAQVIDAMSRRPAERFGLGHRKGQLAAGFDADVVVFDPDRRWRVAAAELHSNAGWSPYEGRTVTGRVAMTLLRGSVVYDGSDVVGEPGHGRFVARAGVTMTTEVAVALPNDRPDARRASPPRPRRRGRPHCCVAWPSSRPWWSAAACASRSWPRPWTCR